MKSVKLKHKQGLNDNKSFKGEKKACNETVAFWIKQLSKQTACSLEKLSKACEYHVRMIVFS